MSAVEFRTKKGLVGSHEVVILEMVITKEILEPEDLRSLEYPDIKADVIILSGRAPIWLYVNVAHFYMHIVKALAIYDPKIDGAIIVVSHDKNFRVGEIIQL